MRHAILLAALCAACAGAASAAPPPVPPPPPVPQSPLAHAARTLSVSGEGRAVAAPDTAILSVGVQSLGKTLARTSAEANERMQRVLDALAKAGVPAKDVRTTNHEVSIERPWQEGRPGPITGYRVSTSAEVRVRDLRQLGPVLDQVVAAGSNDVSGLRLVKDDPSVEQQRALADAVARARAKAEVIARAAGVSLGEIVSLTESAAGPPVPYAARSLQMAEARGGAPVAEGELEFTGQVAVVFAIR
jgi:uncharacterized protein YggE